MQTRLETLPKDVIEKITNELSPSDFVNFCANNYSICNSNEIYFRRMQKDFPFLIQYYKNIKRNAKNIYLKLFSDVSKVAEESVNLLLDYLGDLSKYLKKSFREDVYSFFFNQTVEILNNSLLFYTTERYMENLDILGYFVKEYEISFDKFSLLHPFGLYHGREISLNLFFITRDFLVKMFKQLLKKDLNKFN